MGLVYHFKNRIYVGSIYLPCISCLRPSAVDPESAGREYRIKKETVPCSARNDV